MRIVHGTLRNICGLETLEGLLNLRPLRAEGSHTSQKSSHSVIKNRIIEVVKAAPLKSIYLEICTCLIGFPPSLTTWSAIFGVRQVQKNRSNTLFIHLRPTLRPKVIPFRPIHEDFQSQIISSNLHISSKWEPAGTFCRSKSKLALWGLKISDLAILH